MEGELDAEDEYVFEDDFLAWGDVARAAGAEEPTRPVRSTSTQQHSNAGSSSSSVDPIEVEDEESEEEDVDGYKSNDDGLDGLLVDDDL